jgi:YVTN family beta-propeller protein
MAIRRFVRVSGAIVAAALAVAIPVTVLGKSGPPAHKAADQAIGWVPSHGGESLDPVPAPDYLAYVALGNDDEVVRVEVEAEAEAATARITGTISDDTGDGVAVTPSDSTVYIADTGQYFVLAYNVATRAKRRIQVGPYPQDVAISPDGDAVYATVNGAGGPGWVAVISTATKRVTGDIPVGTAPRAVVFAPDGDHAYVTTQDGIYVIDVASSSVVRVFRAPFDDRQGPQGIAVSADGKTLYVTYPGAGSLWELDAATGAPQGVATVGDEPYAVTAAGPSLYVADMNDDAVSVVSTVTGKLTGTIAVGKLPMSIATTPDGAQVWVGNGLSGSVSVISVASGAVVATIGGGPGTSALDAAPLGLAFAHP